MDFRDVEGRGAGVTAAAAAAARISRFLGSESCRTGVRYRSENRDGTFLSLSVHCKAIFPVTAGLKIHRSIGHRPSAGAGDDWFLQTARNAKQVVFSRDVSSRGLIDVFAAKIDLRGASRRVAFEYLSRMTSGPSKQEGPGRL